MPPPAYRNRILASLSETEKNRLEPFLKAYRFGDREVLSCEGEPIVGVYFPSNAVLSCIAQMPEGTEAEVAMIGNEGFSGFSLINGPIRSPISVIVQISGNGWFMRASDFSREVVDRQSELLRLTMRYLISLLRQVAQISGCNATHSVEQRLSRWLLMAKDRADRDVFSMTHDIVAAMISVRRASVTEVALGLREAGAITYGYGEIRIVDAELLQQKSCGCYHGVHATMEQTFADD